MPATAKQRSFSGAAIIISMVAALGGLTACGTPDNDEPDAGRAAELLDAGLAQLEQARITRDDQDYVAADALLQDAAQASPQDADILVAQASVAAARHRFVDAIELTTNIFDSDPQRVDALAIRGDAYLALGDGASAAADHRQLHELSPGPGSLIRLAHGLEESGDPWAARELAMAALREVESNERTTGDGARGETAAWYRWRAGDLNRHLGDLDVAEALFSEAAAIVPGYALALEGLIDVALQRGDIAGANAALDSWPGNTVLRMESELALANALGDGSEAERLHQEIISTLDGRDPVTSGLDLAAALLQADPTDAGILELTAAEITRRNNAGTLSVHASALLAAGQPIEALEIVQRFLVTGTNEPDRLLIAAEVYLANGDPTEARVQLRRALDVNANPTASALLAELDR